MLDINQLDNLDYIMNNIMDIYKLHKDLGNIIDSIKVNVKQSWQDYVAHNWKIKYISSNKLVPTDWDKLLTTYPIDKYREIYDIRLSAKAGEVITDDTLVHYEPIESIKFIINKDSTDEHKSDDAGEIPNV